MSEEDRLIRQFLRGDAEGPITQRKTETNYAEDLLGTKRTSFGEGPSIQSTRTV